MVFVLISLFKPVQSGVFCFFFSDTKHFSDRTFLVHISMGYLIVTSQNLKTDFFPPSKSSCEEEVKLDISEPSKGDRGNLNIFAKSILFV